MKKALKRQGRKNFVKIVLFESDLKNELNLWEEFYISLFDSRNPEIGYNIRKGGENKSFSHTQDSLNKIRIRSQQVDNKERIRDIQKLAWEARKGTHHSKQSKLQMLNTKFGKNRVIEIYNLNNQYITSVDTAPEAAKLTGIKRSTIANNLCGISKQTSLFVFKYKEVNNG